MKSTIDIKESNNEEDIRFLGKILEIPDNILMLEHPLSIYLKFQTPWQTKWLRELVDTISKIQLDNKNFLILKDKLNDFERFSEGLLFLYFIDVLQKLAVL